ncbi:MAG: hypothetical protein ACLQBD_00840 [Syntrophobacteraceae bacterium]
MPPGSGHAVWFKPIREVLVACPVREDIINIVVRCQDFLAELACFHPFHDFFPGQIEQEFQESSSSESKCSMVSGDYFYQTVRPY